MRYALWGLILGATACTTVNYVESIEDCTAVYDTVCDDDETRCYACSAPDGTDLVWRCTDGWEIPDGPAVADELSCHCFPRHLWWMCDLEVSHE